MSGHCLPQSQTPQEDMQGFLVQYLCRYLEQGPWLLYAFVDALDALDALESLEALDVLDVLFEASVEAPDDLVDALIVSFYPGGDCPCPQGPGGWKHPDQQCHAQ